MNTSLAIIFSADTGAQAEAIIFVIARVKYLVKSPDTVQQTAMEQHAEANQPMGIKSGILVSAVSTNSERPPDDPNKF
ncbi:hypothetical protein OB236_10910 [Paenibacillus sp. WQ 127069]|uniref:Uncharacterized protein n=1 Tax=Paenibacillus baimaensis TaxID=2982185 RepID=A0ABT2UDA5_9BACL|nr:hypothetical protein [Paenibacillus sp. WQ 127069]